MPHWQQKNALGMRESRGEHQWGSPARHLGEDPSFPWSGLWLSLGKEGPKGTARNSRLASLWDLSDHFHNLVASSGMSQEKTEFNTGGGKITTGHC